MKKWGVALAFSLFIYSGTQAFQASHSATPNNATVGEPITYALHIFTNDDEQLNKPIIQTQLGPFSVLIHDVTEDTEDGTTHYQLVQSIATYQTGTFYVPTQTITITHRGETKQEILPALPITIASIRSSTADVTVAPIKPSMPLAGRWFFWVAIILIALVIGGIAAAVVAYRNRHALIARFKNQTISNVSPKDLALARLNRLKAQKCHTETEQIAQYDDVSDLLRSYLGDVFETGFMEHTTAECNALLMRLDVDQESIKRITGLLNRCDDAKFASKIEPSALADSIARCQAIITRINDQFLPEDENDATEEKEEGAK